MKAPLVVLRPEPGQTATLVAAFKQGLRAVGMPLCKVSSVDWKAPAERFDGLLLGSANAIRHAGPELDKIIHLPVFCVGETTARLARDAGMMVELAGSRGLQSIIDRLDGDPRHLLRLAGEIHLSLQTPESLTIDTCVTYRTQYLPLSQMQATLLEKGAIVLLHSGEMAEHFRAQCDAHGIARRHFSLVALAPRIAERAGGGWGSVTVADDPTDVSLLAAARPLCDKGI